MIEPSEHRPTVAVVDLNAIQHNIAVVLDRMVDDQQLYAVVKADGYGHGAIQVAKTAVEAGAKGIAVATVDEAIELRTNGLSQIPILVMGLTDPQGIAEILHYNLTVTVSGVSFFEKAYAQLEVMRQTTLLNVYRLQFHLKLDTGMGRIGLTTVEAVKAFAQEVAGYEWAEWAGVFTHFSTVGGGDESYIDYQWEQWISLLTAVPATVKVRHYANSAMGLWHSREPKSDIVRYGIAMYGVDPKDHLPVASLAQEQLSTAQKTEPQQDDLLPALQLMSEIIYCKQVPAGTHISYGASYTAEQDEWIATVPVGYADGWFRHYKSVSLLVDGQECPVVGPINMDQLMIRLPREYPVGTMVTLIGRDGHLNNHVSLIAQAVDTIGYEILCGIGSRVPRIYLKEEA